MCVRVLRSYLSSLLVIQKLQPTTAVFVPLAILHLAQGPGEIKRREVKLDSQESSGEIKSREVELGFHRELDSQLLLQLFLNSCFFDIVFVILLLRAVETAVNEVHRLLGTGGIPTSLTLFSVAGSPPP